MRFIFEREIFTYLMIGMITVGVLSKFVIGIIYDVLIRETENIGSSKNRLLKQMKLKFENCYKLNLGVSNTGVFVDKYMYKYRICGISLSQLDTFSDLVMIVIVILNLIAFVYSLSGNYGMKDYLWYGIITAVSWLLFQFIDKAIDVDGKQTVVRVNIRDYLENSLSNRLANEYAAGKASVRQETRAGSAVSEMEIDRMKKQLDEMEAKPKEETDKKKDLLEEEVIHEILKEFLT